MNRLNELIAERDAKREQVAKLFKEGGSEFNLSEEQVGEIQSLNAAINDLTGQIEKLQQLAAIQDDNAKALKDAKQPVNLPPQPSGKGDDARPAVRDLATILKESPEVQAHLKGERRGFEFEMTPEEVKTVVTLANISPQTQRLPGILGPDEETRTVADLLLQGTIGVNSLEYYEETTTTNAAATVAEGGVKPESALDFELRTASAKKIATWIPATDELLADMAAMRSYIEGRLRFFVQRVEEAQVLKGDGTGSNLTGILNTSGIQTQAKGTDSIPDAVYKAMTLIRTGAFSDPTGIVFNPADWQRVRLLTTADGVYIWGPPMDPGPERIWGLSVRQTTEMTAGTALLITRDAAQLFRRTGITIAASSEHSDFFVKNQLAIRAEERILLAVYRPSAFATVTGLAA